MLDWLASNWAGASARSEISYVDDGFRAPIDRTVASLLPHENQTAGRPYLQTTFLPSPSRIADMRARASGFGAGGGGLGGGIGFGSGNSSGQVASSAPQRDIFPSGVSDTIADIFAPAGSNSESLPKTADAAPNAANVVVTPLPSSALLLFAGLGGFAALSIRRRG